MFGSLGVPELVLIFLVVLIVFGPRKIPEIGRTLGKALGEFRRATDDLKNTIEREVRLEELKGIKTASMEAFVTPVEAVSRSTPSAVVAPATVAEASPVPPAPASAPLANQAPPFAESAAETTGGERLADSSESEGRFRLTTPPDDRAT